MVKSSFRPAVFMDQGESRAGDIFLSGGLKCTRNSFDQSGFSGAKIAAQQDEFRRDQQAAKDAAESDGLLGRMSRDLL